MNLSTINNAYVGSTAVSKIYLGSTQVWPLYNDYVSAWLGAINKAGFTLPDQNVIDATTTFINNLQTAGLITGYKNSSNKIKRLNLFNGGDYLSSFLPIINDLGAPNDYNGNHGFNTGDLANGNFGARDWNLATGFNASNNPVGTNVVDKISNLRVIDTGVTVSSVSNYDLHFACYISGDGANTATSGYQLTDIGVTNTTPYNYDLKLQCQFIGSTSTTFRWTAYGQSIAQGGISTSSQSPTPTTARGFYVGSRTSTSRSRVYKYINGSAVGLGNNTNTTNISNFIFDNSTVTVFGRGQSGSVGTNKTVSNVTARAMSMYSIGAGLSDEDVVAFYSALYTFNANTAIGR